MSPHPFEAKIVYVLENIHDTNRVLYKADYQLSLKVLFKDIKGRIENGESPHLQPPQCLRVLNGFCILFSCLSLGPQNSFQKFTFKPKKKSFWTVPSP